MKTWILLLATGALLLSGSNGSAQQQVQAPRTLWLSEVPVVINQPGHWVLNRNWKITTEPASDQPMISIAASDVILDLRGFTIEYAVNTEFALIGISGHLVTVQNGRLLGGGGERFGPTLIHTTGEGSNARVQSMTLSGSGTALKFDTEGSRVVDSVALGYFDAVEVASDTLIERTRIGCAFNCLRIQDGTRIVDSSIAGNVPLVIDGSGNHLLNTRITYFHDDFDPIAINGNWNVLRGNILENSTGVDVNGTGNVLDGNIIPRGPDGEIKALSGIRFTVSGNFYGNNRVAAPVPFNLGTTTQTDWGGNVGF